MAENGLFFLLAIFLKNSQAPLLIISFKLAQVMIEIIIKKVILDDVERLQEIGKQTFYETFATENTEENMKKYLDEGFSLSKLIDELNNKNSEFYFAEIDNRVIGYLKLNFAESQTELKSEESLEIERIYVLNEYHGKKVGQLLYERAFSIARENKVNYLWLGVWEKNHRAISFYKRNGFKEFDKHIFRLGDDEQTDVMMKLEMDKTLNK